jgi:hypothetical protein
MDTKKEIKRFIDYICDWVEDEFINKGNNGFSYEFKDDEMSYLLADKGIEKRIKKQLLKKLRLNIKVEHITSGTQFTYSNLDYGLNIKVVKNEDSEILLINKEV